jgi:DNA repair photolyase
MPHCGSQVILCDLPVRFDTYRGCSHACRYCFAAAKRDLTDVERGESVDALRRWIAGQRTLETAWCDWDIPLHWGGLSDPFQPCERRDKRSLACLDAFAESGYPVVISTKGTLLGERVYLDRLRRCNAVVQVSLVAPSFAPLEPNAPPFRQRFALIRRLVPHVRRVLVRIQPYMPQVFQEVLRSLPRYAAAGVHGIIVEGLKRKRAAPGTLKVAGDWCLPIDQLAADFRRLRDRCHALRLRFYCAENRLRRLTDDRCCCGMDGLAGFRPNRANLNSLVFGASVRYSARMRAPGNAGAFKGLCQDAPGAPGPALASLSYAGAMGLAATVPAYRAALGLPPKPNRTTDADPRQARRR